MKSLSLLLSALAFTASAQAEVPLIKQDTEAQKLVAKYTPSADAAVEKYANARVEEEYEKGQMGCQLGYALVGKEPYVHAYSYDEHVFYATLYFQCTDDDAYVSLAREAVYIVCKQDKMQCSVSQQ